MKRFVKVSIKKISLTLMVSALISVALASPAIVVAQTVTSVNMAFNPSSPTAEAGQPFSTTVVVTLPSNGAPVAGDVWIDKVVKTSNSAVAYTAGSSPSTIPLSAGGSAILSYALAQGGTYTVDVCYRQTSSSGCIVKNQAFVATINDPTSTATASTTPTTPAVSQSSQVVSLPNPIACNDATCLIGQVVRYILGSIAVVATLMFIWGGVMMLTSGGNADQVKRAKETLVWAAIGVVVILLSWVIIKAVLQALTKTSS